MTDVIFLFPEFLSKIENFDRVEICGYETAGEENSPAVFFEEIIGSSLSSSFEVKEELCKSIEFFKFMFYKNNQKFHTFKTKIEYLNGHTEHLSKTGKYKIKKKYEVNMKIIIPEKIKAEIDLIESLKIEAIYKENYDNYINELPISYVEQFDFTEIRNTIFEKCDKIQYRITYKNNTTEIFKFNSKEQSIYRSKLNATAQQCVRHKTSELFDDCDEGRLDCLAEIDNKILQASSLSKEPKGTKNLIYYTIYFNKGYIELLNKSIMSLIEKSKITFDLLLITDEATKEFVLKQPFIKKIQPKFLITKIPFDGIEASQNKIRVFEYENINDYDKVLFLDCDIICLNDVNKIFKQNVEINTLYTARNLNLNHTFHKSFHHGFEFLDEDHIQEMKLAKQWPFNAGQFMFRTSDRMQAHFDNVKWFMHNWAGEYFFEQAFMCYYFCKAYLTDDSILQKHMSIVSTINKSEYHITKDTCLVHFIAPPLDAKTKSEFIDEFIEEHNKSATKKIVERIKHHYKKISKRS